MEKRLNSIYSRAQKEISEKWDAYMKSHEEKVKSAYDDLQEAIKSGDRDAIKEARDIYERTVKNATLNDERYKAMVDETTAKLAHTNEVALDYVNGNMAKVYTLNFNDFSNEEITGYTFTLVNEQAVKDLAKEDKSLLPVKKLDIPKDKKWNTKSINSEVLQGILQGENIPKIAKRLTHVTDMNRKSSIRNARTMVTCAENKGRQDSFKKAESDGVIMKRIWVAAHDDRTRAWHSDLDGVEVDIDEPWQNDYGEIMYPGDPTAHPGNVYNCRCSIRAIVKGFRWDQDEEDEFATNKYDEKIQFDWRGKEEKHAQQQQIISDLANEYNTRLQRVTVGAERGAGDVDMSGATLRLNTSSISDAMHEFGHTLANTNADKYGLTNDKDFWKEIKKIRAEYLKDVADDTTRWISVYEHSSKSVDEFLCEAFTQSKMHKLGLEVPSKYGIDLTYSNRVLDVVDKYFRRKKK